MQLMREHTHARSHMHACMRVHACTRACKMVGWADEASSLLPRDRHAQLRGAMGYIGACSPPQPCQLEPLSRETSGSAAAAPAGPCAWLHAAMSARCWPSTQHPCTALRCMPQRCTSLSSLLGEASCRQHGAWGMGHAGVAHGTCIVQSAITA